MGSCIKSLSGSGVSWRALLVGIDDASIMMCETHNW